VGRDSLHLFALKIGKILNEIAIESSPKEIGHSLLQKIENFEKGRGEASDDITLLLMQYKEYNDY
jgi:serine phosphatase RsbU (regulator of sigma subunit)